MSLGPGGFGDDCGAVREALPAVASQSCDHETERAVRAHAASCAECAAELELVALLRASRPRPPQTLAERVTRALEEGAWEAPGEGEVDGPLRRRPAHPVWGLSAAAVAALALGIGIVSSPGGDEAPEVPPYASEVAADAELWASDDGLVAGAPVWDGLTDEALEALLEELSSGAPGGSA